MKRDTKGAGQSKPRLSFSYRTCGRPPRREAPYLAHFSPTLSPPSIADVCSGSLFPRRPADEAVDEDDPLRDAPTALSSPPAE